MHCSFNLTPLIFHCVSIPLHYRRGKLLSSIFISTLLPIYYFGPLRQSVFYNQFEHPHRIRCINIINIINYDFALIIPIQQLYANVPVSVGVNSMTLSPAQAFRLIEFWYYNLIVAAVYILFRACGPFHRYAF